MSCKGDRDYRASEYVSMMPTTLSIQVAIKYAAKVRKLALGERLAAIGRRKQDEESEGVEDFDGDFENIQQGNIIYSSVYTSLGNRGNQVSANDGFSSSYLSGNSAAVKSNSSADLGILEGKLLNTPNQALIETMTYLFLAENPLLRKQRAEIGEILSSSVYSNPFKKSVKGKGESTPDQGTASSDSESVSGRGLALIDVWKKPPEKPSLEFNPKGPKGVRGKKGAVEKEVKEKGKQGKGSVNPKIASGKVCKETASL